MNRLNFITENISRVKEPRIRKLIPGFKFAIGDKLRLVYKSPPRAYNLSYKVGDIVIVSATAIFDNSLPSTKAYNFEGDLN